MAKVSIRPIDPQTVALQWPDEPLLTPAVAVTHTGIKSFVFTRCYICGYAIEFEVLNLPLPWTITCPDCKSEWLLTYLRAPLQAYLEWKAPLPLRRTSSGVHAYCS